MGGKWEGQTVFWGGQMPPLIDRENLCFMYSRIDTVLFNASVFGLNMAENSN